MNSLVKFFHELFNPHCIHCKNEKIAIMEQEELNREINEVCPTCEVLKLELGQANNRISQLLEYSIKPKEEIVKTEITEQPRILNRNSHIPFSVMRQKLERESREEARRIKEKSLESAAKPDNKIEKLENELGISNA